MSTVTVRQEGSRPGEATRERAQRRAPARAGDVDLDAVLADEGAPLFTVGQVAELVGMRPWFLRRLDAMGVVTPTRSGGDQRRYSRADIRRLLDAQALMRDGVSVTGVRYVFELEKKVAGLEEELAAMREEMAGVPGGGPARRRRSTHA